MNEISAHAESALFRTGSAPGRELRDSQFRSLVETSPRGIVVHRNWKILYANQAAAGTLGYGSVAELLAGKCLLALFHEDDRSRLKSYQDARITNQQAPERHRARLLREPIPQRFSPIDGTVRDLEEGNQEIPDYQSVRIRIELAS